MNESMRKVFKKIFKPRIELAKGTRFVSFVFIVVSAMAAAGVLFAANIYYDIDATTIKMEDSTQLTGSTVTLNPTGAVTITAGATSTWKTTTGNLTVQAEGNLVFNTTGGTIDLSNQATAMNLIDSQTQALNIESGLLNLDTGNTRVGIGTSSPSGILSVATTTGAEYLTVADGGSVGIGTTSPAALLDVYGPSNKIRLSYDSGNYADLSVDSGGVLTINPTGGDTHIQGDLHISGDYFSTSTPAAIRKDDELILREVVPIFGFDLPAETAASSSYVTVSRTVEDYPFSATTTGTTRVHKFMIRYADATTTASTTWHVYNDTDGQVHATFTVPATASATTTKGEAYITGDVNVPKGTDDWYLEVINPPYNTTTKIRIYAITLAAYDRVE